MSDRSSRGNYMLGNVTLTATGSTDVFNIPGCTLYVQTDPADDAVTAIRRLREERERLRAQSAESGAAERIARLRAADIDARHEAAWHYLTAEGIPERCESGTLLTLAQRVVLLAAERGGE